jgi:uncharacterized protein
VRSLLDTNVLIALLDPAHIHHDIAHHWFANLGETGWATCPITQNGFVRIVSQPRYSNPVSTALAAALLASFVSAPAHEFWPDSISLCERNLIDATRLMTASQITDSYLLALAVKNGGILVSLDSRLLTSAVKLGEKHLLLLN